MSTIVSTILLFENNQNKLILDPSAGSPTETLLRLLLPRNHHAS